MRNSVITINTLSFYILTSIQNRLSLVDEYIKIYARANSTTIKIHLPADDITCLERVVRKYE